MPPGWGTLPAVMRATAEGTASYATRFPRAAPGHFRPAVDLTWSSIGLGTYLGRTDEATDHAYREAVVAAVESGVNLVDTAANYRFGQSERAIGQALADLFGRGYRREEIVVCTKGGYVPSPDPLRYFRDEIVARGLAGADDLLAGCHSVAPGYLRHQLATSLQSLGLDAVDVYYLHNPEQQLDEIPPRLFRERMLTAFEALEEEAARGRLGVYGTATWNGYREPPGARGWLSLEGLVQTAREVAGESHRFRVVQAPFNLAMTEIFGEPTQSVDGQRMPLVYAADALGVTVVASASILQGRLSRGLPVSLEAAMPGTTTQAQRALQFVRSVPGITTALVGMSRLDHVRENLRLVDLPPVDEKAFASFFSQG
jgi:aryl-alcohol dehydrogenase-like predicted oxidoreductase